MARKKDDSAAPASSATTGASTSAGKAGKTPKAPKVKKTRWYHQVWQAYQMTRRHDPAVTWWLLATFFGVLAIGAVIGALTDNLVYFVLLSMPFALLGAMFLLARRAERSAYAQIEGQPGAALSALKTIRRGWSFEDEPVAIDARNQEFIFRGIGRPGIVLVSEAPPSRAARQLEAERKRTARVLPSVPIHLIQVGREEGQVELSKLPSKVRRLPRTLSKPEVGEINKRLTALGTVRLPVPKGIDPMRARPDRKGMRGR